MGTVQRGLESPLRHAAAAIGAKPAAGALGTGRIIMPYFLPNFNKGAFPAFPRSVCRDALCYGKIPPNSFS